MMYLTAAFLGSLAAFSYVAHRLTSLVTDERERAFMEREKLLQWVHDSPAASAVVAQRDMDDWEPQKLHLAFDADQEFDDYVKGSLDD